MGRSMGLALVVIGILAAADAAAQSADRHAGYYYPKPQSVEVYKARTVTMMTMDRHQRIQFVVGVVEDMTRRPFPPGLSFFAKGTDTEKLIIGSNRAGQLDTIYRVRALLATLTSSARTTTLFRDYNVGDILTFLDMLKILGFRQITVSDGDTFAHQIKLQ